MDKMSRSIAARILKATNSAAGVSKKTYPISRVLTSTPLAAMQTALGAAQLNPFSVVQGIGGRAYGARGILGRASVGQGRSAKRVFKSEGKIIKALRGSGVAQKGKGKTYPGSRLMTNVPAGAAGGAAYLGGIGGLIAGPAGAAVGAGVGAIGGGGMTAINRAVRSRGLLGRAAVKRFSVDKKLYKSEGKIMGALRAYRAG